MNEEVLGVIYKISTTINSNIYIGSSIKYKKRKSKHLSQLKTSKHQNKKLQRHVDKYGIDCLYFEVIEIDIPFNNLANREQYYIDSLKPAFNCNPFAFCIAPRSEEAKIKLGLLAKGRKFTEDHKRKISEALKGRIRDKEWCEKISMRKKGVPQSQETIANRVLKNTGKRRSPEVREKMSLAMTGILKSEEGKRNMSIGRQGLKLTEEHRKNIGIASKERLKNPEVIQKLISASTRGGRSHTVLNFITQSPTNPLSK
jgi:group I intron endonuclease